MGSPFFSPSDFLGFESVGKNRFGGKQKLGYLLGQSTHAEVSCALKQRSIAQSQWSDKAVTRRDQEGFELPFGLFHPQFPRKPTFFFFCWGGVLFWGADFPNLSPTQPKRSGPLRGGGRL